MVNRAFNRQRMGRWKLLGRNADRNYRLSGLWSSGVSNSTQVSAKIEGGLHTPVGTLKAEAPAS